MNKKVSVIVPVYNGEQFIINCLTQLDNQTLKGIEIIVVDDGSNDKTLELANSFKMKYQTLIILQQSHMGVSNARNIGISNASSEFVTFVDVDDFYDNDMLELYYKNAIKNNSDIVCIEKVKSNDYILNYNSKQIKKMLLDSQISMSCCFKFFKRSLCNNMFDPSIKIYEDFLAFYNVLKKAKNIVIVNDIKYHYEHRENSSSRTPNFEKKYFDAIKVVNFIYDDVGKSDSDLLEYAEKRKYNTYLRIIKIYYLRNGYKKKKYEKEINELSIELLKINSSKRKFIFSNKNNYYRFLIYKNSKLLFKLLVKTIDKR